MSEQTASQARYGAHQALLTVEYLQRSAQARIEAISGHYASLAMLALHLKQAADFRQRNEPDKAINEVINHAVQQIIAQHVTDFGVEPSWARMWTPL